MCEPWRRWQMRAWRAQIKAQAWALSSVEFFRDRLSADSGVLIERAPTHARYAAHVNPLRGNDGNNQMGTH